MRNWRRFPYVVTLCWFSVCFVSPGTLAAKNLEEDNPLPAKKQARIEKLASLSVDHVFQELQHPELFVDKKALDKAVRHAFKDRKATAIARSLEELRGPINLPHGEYIFHNDNFDIAKYVLKAFPDESVSSLLALYSTGDGVVRGNVILVLGALEAESYVRPVLIGALDDVTPWNEQTTEPPDQPMRICDLAYNQIVLRYRVKGVLRTTGTSYTNEERDAHIQWLKEVLGIPADR